jgi:hypothetical protein
MSVVVYLNLYSLILILAPNSKLLCKKVFFKHLSQFMSGEVTNHLFEEKNVPFSGLDLVSILLNLFFFIAKDEAK